MTYGTETIEGTEGQTEFTLSTGDKVTITPAATATITHVAEGTVKNAFSYTLENAGFYSNVTKTEGDLSITKAPLTITADSNSKVYDGTPLTDDGWQDTAPVGLKGTDTVASVTVTGSQTLVGDSDNTASNAIVKNGDKDVTANYEIEYVKGTLTVTDGTPDKPVDPALVVTKADSDTTADKKYHVGDTVTFKITAKNIYEDVQTITLSEITDVTLEQSEFKNVAGGDTVETTATYVIKVADVTDGSFTNTVTATMGNITKEAKATVKTETIKIEITADSDSKVYDGEPLTNDGYKLTDGTLATGDTITSVTVTGIQTLVGSSNNEPSDAVIKNAAGKVVTEAYKITYVNGTLTVTDGTPDEPVEPDLVVTKSHTGSDFKLGDTVTFNITATNIYEEPQTITLSEIDGVTLAESVFENVKGGKTISTTATYTITEADILAQEFVNTVTATLGNIKKEATDTVTADEIADKNGHLTIEKVTTSTAKAEDGKYALGEKITYEITVTNDGNLTITNITVTDELTGDKWTIESLAPGKSEAFETSYTVTEADVLAGQVVNVATGKGTSPDPDKPDVPVVPGEDPEPTDIRKDMTVDSESLKVKYDGKSHTVTAKSNVDDATIEYSIDGGSTWSKTAPSLTDVGVITFSVRATRTGYETVQKHGFKLEVTPREITLTSASGSKWYDGTPLRNQTVTVSEDGFVDGEGATYNITGSQTNVGQSANTFTYTLNANTKAGNYKVTTVAGVLTVLPEEVPLGLIGSFSFYFISDTNLAETGKKADAYKDIFDWIKKNNERLGALAIIGSGNAVADGKDEDAWKLIKDELDNLERKPNELPYYNIAGTNEVNGDELDYETYTKNKLCEVNERNEYEDGQIWYQPYDELQLLFVGIGYQKLLDPEKATDEEKEAQEKWLKYVNDVLARYPEYTAVLLVNDFIEHDPDSKKDDGRLTEFGELIEKRIVAGNDNVALVLCGNAEGTARWHKAYGERNVNAIMYNYQNDEENGLGFFRIITLNGEAKTITVTTYSPTLDKDSYDEDHPEYDFYVIDNAF